MDRAARPPTERSGDAREAEATHNHAHHPLAVAPTRSEWISALIGAALVLATIGYLLANVLGRANTPPDIRIEIGQVLKVGGGYLVRFQATNLGQTTAAELTIEAALSNDRGTVETNSIMIDYMPPGASRRGGFFFSRNPRDFRLEARPGGYRQP